ncbi:hypothetical protein [Catenulispora pinisilvae]|uniref:hypothetical protein n=1 Tax=Catenulispora pinisilvae TaxID=2705253 RepID=UPI001890BF3A|nr:hypothetical protein [Catenulispora pinisilvae]
MPETPRPATSGLAARARAAATQRRADAANTADLATWRDPRWVALAEQCADALARVLNTPRDQITVAPDRLRAYGGWTWPLLVVIEPDGSVFEFVAAYNDPGRLLALAPCPHCGQQVPYTAIGHLADLGELLDDRAGQVTQPEQRQQYLPLMHGDPGHDGDCPLARLA